MRDDLDIFFPTWRKISIVKEPERDKYTEKYNKNVCRES